MTDELTEYETLAMRMHLLEREVREIRADVRAGNESVAELVELWKGTKSVVSFARVTGKFTIAFSLFGGAVASLYFLGKAFLLLMMKGFRP